MDLTDEQILRKLVALNAERADEERRGIVRRLRPEFQYPGGAATTRQSPGIGGIDTAARPGKAKRAVKPAWPKAIVTRVLALRAALASAAGPVSAAQIAATFKGVKAVEIGELLVALEALGQARKLDGERFAA